MIRRNACQSLLLFSIRGASHYPCASLRSHCSPQAFFIPLLWTASATAILWSEPGVSAPVATAAKPYSPAVRKGNTVYVAGQTPNDQKTGEIVGVTIEEQTKQVIQNIEAILTKEGMTLSNVVSTTVYLSDLNDVCMPLHLG